MKKETLAQMFSCEFCEISENTFFTEHLWRIPLICNFWVYVECNVLSECICSDSKKYEITGLFL